MPTSTHIEHVIIGTMSHMLSRGGEYPLPSQLDFVSGLSQAVIEHFEEWTE